MRSGLSLLAPTLTPTMPRRVRRASRAWTASWPSLLKPRRLISASCSVSRKRRGRRVALLRPRRHGADLDEAEAEVEERVGDLAVLVEAPRPCREDWGSRGRGGAGGDVGSGAGALGITPAASARIAMRWAVSGIEAEEERPGERPEPRSRQFVRKDVQAVGAERQRLDPEHGGEVERREEMREQLAAARRLVFQRLAERAPCRSRPGRGPPVRRNGAARSP